jgi:2-polyprenyl-3-methyl-5-hydroxy-6-metoxy-1,4-benzoquinol methylase
MEQAIDEAVAEQYRECPYPPRNPDDEEHRLLSSHLGDLTRINGLLWGGRKRIEHLRLLDAGCGTGDSAVYMAAQAPEATVVALDQSGPSLAIARRRAEVRGLRNIEFVHASLLDLPRLGLGPFDYIVCSGVLHHLDDPAAGARALTTVLTGDGGLGLLLYGQIGRMPIYQLQDLMLRVCAGEPLAHRVALAEQALHAVAPGHFFKVANLDRELLDASAFGAAGIVDLLLHARDRAYTIDELYGLLDDTGLQLLSFVRPLFYRPESYALSEDLRERVGRLNERERQAIAELLNGRLAVHQFFAARKTFVPDVPSAAQDPSRIRPVIYEAALRDFFAGMPDGAQPFRLDSTEGFTVALSLTAVDAALLKGVDGHRSLRAVIDDARAALRRTHTPASSVDLHRAWRQIAAALEPAGCLGYDWTGA